MRTLSTTLLQASLEAIARDLQTTRTGYPHHTKVILISTPDAILHAHTLPKTAQAPSPSPSAYPSLLRPLHGVRSSPSLPALASGYTPSALSPSTAGAGSPRRSCPHAKPVAHGFEADGDTEGEGRGFTCVGRGLLAPGAITATTADDAGGARAGCRGRSAAECVDE